MQPSALRKHADKKWWRDELLLEIPVSAVRHSDKAAAPPTQEHLALLERAAQWGISGVCLTPTEFPHEPLLRQTSASSAPRLEAQYDALEQTARSLGLKTLNKLAPNTTAKHRSAIQPGPTASLVGHQAKACALHAQLCCALKLPQKIWPLWHLPPAEAMGVCTLRQWYSTLALQFSVRGTPVIRAADLEQLQQWRNPAPLHEGASAACLQKAFADMLLWRKRHAALVSGTMKLLPVHEHLLCFIREHQGQRILCVFNWSERYVRVPLMPSCIQAHLIPGSLMCGGRIVNNHIDCDPWGGFFAALEA